MVRLITMKTTISKHINHSILVEPEELKSLFDFISSKYKEIEATGNCSDGSSLETKNIQELLSFDNLTHRRFTSIAIRARDSFDETCSLEIHSDGLNSLFSTVDIYLTSQSDERAVYVVHEIIQRFLNMKPSYDWIARTSVILATAIVIGVLGLLLNIGILPSAQRTQSSISEYVNQGLLFFTVFIAITYPIDLLRKYLFPKVFFVIGRQKKTLEMIGKIRSFIFISVILAIILSVIANWISIKLF
jgi:hypothetical protein